MSKDKEAQPRERLFRVVPVFPDPTQAQQDFDGGAVLRGKVHDVLVVSVPPNMPMATVDSLMKTLKEQLTVEFLVLTHNIEFLRVRELTEGEARLVTESTQTAGNVNGRESGAD